MAYNPINLGPTNTINSQAVVLPYDQVAIPVTGPLTDTEIRATALPISGTVTATQATAANLNATVVGTGTFAVQADQSGTWNIDTLTTITNAVTVSQSTATSLKAQAENYQGGSAVSNTNPLYVTAIATNANGYSVAAGSIGNTVTNIGTLSPPAPGIVAGWYIYNPNPSIAYVQFFNLQASAVSLGSTAPFYSIGIPGFSAANLMSPTGITHNIAISIAVTTTRAGSTNVASTVDYNIFYKQ